MHTHTQTQADTHSHSEPKNGSGQQTDVGLEGLSSYRSFVRSFKQTNKSTKC